MARGATGLARPRRPILTEGVFPRGDPPSLRKRRERPGAEAAKIRPVRRRVAVLGLGDIASKAYLPILTARDDLDLLLFSRSAATVERQCARYRLPSGTTGLDDLLARAPEAAFILTPSPTHFGLARTLLEAGVDVFVEKPATMASGETLLLTELAQRLGRVFMVGFNRRFAPLTQKARSLWEGRGVSLALFQKHRASAAHADLFHNYIDDTIHVIDLLRFLCGEGAALKTVAHLREGRLVGASSIVALEGGGHAILATSLDAGRWEETYRLFGATTSLDLEAFSRLRFVSKGEERVFREPYASDWRPSLLARGFPQQVDHFLSCVDSRRAPSTSGIEAYRTQRLLEDLVACVWAQEPPKGPL